MGVRAGIVTGRSRADHRAYLGVVEDALCVLFFQTELRVSHVRIAGAGDCEPLLSPSLPWPVPSSVFDHLIRVKRDGKPLVRQVKRIPSCLNRYREQYHRLDKDQQNIVSDFVERHRGLAQTGYPSLNTPEQTAVVDTLRDYYQFALWVLAITLTTKRASLTY